MLPITLSGYRFFITYNDVKRNRVVSRVVVTPPDWRHWLLPVLYRVSNLLVVQFGTHLFQLGQTFEVEVCHLVDSIQFEGDVPTRYRSQGNQVKDLVARLCM